jgi:2-C-methyl-D-erythritol 4-phosphate cytidylyltransferase
LTVWAVVVAAGTGTRFGGPKQYEVVAGRRLLDWSLDAARSAADGVVLVVAADAVEHPEPAADAVVAGADTRSGSVRAGLAAVPAVAEVVVVHDAARPAARLSLFESVIAAVRAGADAAIPGVPVVDTVKRVAAGVVVETLDRDTLVAVQTPQAFRADVLRGVSGEATDDAALVEAAGGRVVVVPGDPANLKVTEPADLAKVAGSLGGWSR